MTHYLGIDLAWGNKQPTGLAVLDDDARLLHVSAVRTDDEIVAALAPYLEPAGASPGSTPRSWSPTPPGRGRPSRP